LKHKAVPWSHAEDATALSLSGQRGVDAVPLAASATGQERGISSKSHVKEVRDVIWTLPWSSLVLHLTVSAKIAFGMRGQSGASAANPVMVDKRLVNVL